MTNIPISPITVRLALLSAQALLKPPSGQAQKQDVLTAIQKMGALQIDTISVVARSPYMVLFSRIGAYPSEWLDELLAEGSLFEYWAHAACFIPIEDYPLYRRMMLDDLRGWSDGEQWLADRATLVDEILNRIRAEGPLRSLISNAETVKAAVGGIGKKKKLRWNDYSMPVSYPSPGEINSNDATICPNASSRTWIKSRYLRLKKRSGSYL
jgi:uncharacterized protein YcaQ